MKRPVAAVLIAVSAALLLGACGTETPVSTAQVTSAKAAVQADGDYNDTDVMFLQMMVAHHEQGLKMVRLAESRAGRSEIATLATAIDATQSDEVTMMTSWLEGWSKPTTVDHAPSAHADHGGLPATGPEEIEALRTGKGAAFDTTFLNLFIAHQHNAVEMAHLESTNGANAEAKALADRIRQSRTDQIQQMLTLLNS